MRLVFLHIVDDNFGDVNCSPKFLRPEWREFPEYAIRQYQQHTRPNDILIVGGGGLLHPPGDRWIQIISRKRPVFLWGVGINYHDGNVPDLRPLLERCVRVTLRHRENPAFDYCPCPSLARPEFLDYLKAPAALGADLVLYSHRKHVISQECGIRGIPELINSQSALQRDGKNDLLSVLRFLGSGRIVVTNSYHGAVWAMALDRPVILWRPFSTRFSFQQPLLRDPDATVSTGEELRRAVGDILKKRPAPGARGKFPLLHEARQRILDEATRIADQLAGRRTPA